VNQIMTVTMQQRQVIVSVVTPVSILMMNLSDVFCHEKQSTVCTPTVLPF
jgi:hypothetical protein